MLKPRRFLLLPLFLAAALACGMFTPTATPRPTLTPPITVTASALPPTATLAPTATPFVEDTPPPTPSVAPSPTVDLNFRLRPEYVHFHPAPQLYSGDIVSVEVIAEGAPGNWEGAPVWLFVGSRADPPLAQTTFSRFGLGGRLQATFTWVWDTRGLAGPQTVWVVVGPAPDATPPLAEESVAVTANLLPAEARPMPEALATWATAQSDCCTFHYLTGTAAERDLTEILATADAAFAHIENVLGVQGSDRIVFTLLSRLLGHGGFAASEISLTYIDRNPAGSNLFNLFAHEGTHLLDREFAALKPTLMTEGLAVYVAGGHFKAENLERRAAALLALDRYLPLGELANDFYPAQHEIGYLEAGAFVDYLVTRYGWDRFKAMYTSFQSAPSEAQMLDQGLRAHFGRGLEELEGDWLRHLNTLSRDAGEIDDLRLTVALYDTLRRYQQLKDPSAHFLNAWLPDGPRARERQITADFVRHPRTPEHLALEAMLQAAGQALNESQPARAAELLDSVNRALDADSLGADALAAEYLAVVNELLDQGYEAQSIRLAGPSAEVTAIRDWPRLDALSLTRAAGGWRLSQRRGQPLSSRLPMAADFGWPRPVAEWHGIIWHWVN